MRLARTFAALLLAVPLLAQTPAFPSEIPANFAPTLIGFDHVRRIAEIPMRDGVKLHTVILIPNGAKDAPMLLTRTPYSADALTSHANSPRMADVLEGYDNPTDVIIEGGYIRVMQDVRGKYGSEGDYVMNRPLRGPLNPTKVDHATDTYDTIDWLVKNVPESNGRVGIIGISYDGFLPLMALIDPHPALKVSVPMCPMVDGWMGDDWFHNGAFRQPGMTYVYEQQATRGNAEKWWSAHRDDYDMFMEAGSAGDLARIHGMSSIGFWTKISEHPAYDSWWQQQAVDKILAARPLTIPVMLVHSLWDQEDIYGAIAVYKAIEPKDTNNDRVYLTMGPWSHGQMIHDGSNLGAIKFGSDTALTFRREVLRPFLDHYLRTDTPPMNVAPVTAFETGTNTWRRMDAWPTGVKPTPLYVAAKARLSFTAPAADAPAFDEYISDPAKPVPYRARPIDSSSWRRWLVDDQRETSGRSDVLTFVSEPLTAPLKISGQPRVHLVASTSGTDSDWVVKVIDLYPDRVAADPDMGGYQLMISADIFRGRYRESLSQPKAIAANQPLPYDWTLPTANHVFLPGHRLMIQIHSSWFPLYDRNPQTFVPNIFFAKPDDYKKATQRVYHAGSQATYVELPVVAMQ
jgi:putative CocE/NonD family hydrolase